jgi:hypothetical protein
MQIIDATPPADFPAQVIMMDKELAKTNSKKGFYLRISLPGGEVKHVDLDDMVTPVGARKAARAQGYEPTHWMRVGDLTPTRFY